MYDSYNVDVWIGASGGESGVREGATAEIVVGRAGNGINGGSGGGLNYYSYSIKYTYYENTASDGGSDGGNGCTAAICFYTWSADEHGINYYESGGTGQGTTTRAFGESDGTLYAGGGGGGGGGEDIVALTWDTKPEYNGHGGAGGGGNGGFVSSDYKGFEYSNYMAKPGDVNTGGGGGGVGIPGAGTTSGGSGIVIIRWGFDSDGIWLGYHGSNANYAKFTFKNMSSPTGDILY
jgi:hypothetical protein